MQFWRPLIKNVSGNKQYLVASAIGCPKTHFLHELVIFWSTKKWRKHIFFFLPLHPHSPVIFAVATLVAFLLLGNSGLNFCCYTQREATPTQKSFRKWRCDLSRLLARKITKGIHSCKLASLNRPIHKNQFKFCTLWLAHTYSPHIIKFICTADTQYCLPLLRILASSL